jgi:hypothetical protein
MKRLFLFCPTVFPVRFSIEASRLAQSTNLPVMLTSKRNRLLSFDKIADCRNHQWCCPEIETHLFSF